MDFVVSLQIKDVTRQIKKAVVASNLQELQKKSSEKFGKTEIPQIHLDSDGTEIDDEDYFQTLEPNTELIAVFSGEQWADVSLIDVSSELNWILMRRRADVKDTWRKIVDKSCLEFSQEKHPRYTKQSWVLCVRSFFARISAAQRVRVQKEKQFLIFMEYDDVL